MKEIPYNFDEFKGKVSMDSPIHHSSVGRFADKQVFIYEATFRIYGVSQEGGHIIIFETTRRLKLRDVQFFGNRHSTFTHHAGGLMEPVGFSPSFLL